MASFHANTPYVTLKKDLKMVIRSGEKRKKSDSSGLSEDMASTPVKSKPKRINMAEDSMNSFETLRESDSGESDSDCDEVAALAEKLKEAMSKEKGEGKGKKKKKKNSGSSKHATGGNDCEIARVVEVTIQNLLPTIVETIRSAVEKSCEKKMSALEGELLTLKESLERDRVLAKIQNDKMEQYSRRENVKVYGMKEREGEKEGDLISLLEEVGTAMEVEVDSKAISAIHRLGRKEQGTRPVIVRFSNRRERSKLLDKKKSLKDNQCVKDNPRLENHVSISEDLTPARRKLLTKVRETERVEFAYVKDGAILAKLRRGPFVRVEDPDDLFKLGIEDVNYRDFFKFE